MKAVIALISLFGCLGGSTFAGSKTGHKDVLPPRITVVSDPNNLPDSVRGLITMSPVAPRGPADVLRGYEDDMRAVSARFVNELAVISKTFNERQITRDAAEHLSEERYLVAMMQFELLSALHAQLEQEVEREENSPNNPVPTRESSIAVVELPMSSFQMNTALARQLGLSSSQIRAIQEIISDERRKQEPLLKDLEVTRAQLSVANQKAHIDDRELNTLAAFEGVAVSKIIVANARMQSRIYRVLNADQKKKLEQFRRTNAVTADTE
jgi:NACalpha-BTF3-like transcription factor